jgi:hypothetical protein
MTVRSLIKLPKNILPENDRKISSYRLIGPQEELVGDQI